MVLQRAQDLAPDVLVLLPVVPNVEVDRSRSVIPCSSAMPFATRSSRACEFPSGRIPSAVRNASAASALRSWRMSA